MTSSSAATGSRLASRLGFSDRVFIGPAARKLAREVEAGLDLVESGLAEDLRVADALADATSRYLYEAGGKRVRPVLALLTAQLGGGNLPAVIDIAKALELTHLGSLYHDDVMDGADRRRGVPAAHAVWGNNVAILTGDILFSRALKLMSGRGDRAIRLQADTFERLVLGQMHETVGPQPGDDPIAFYIQVLADKTGSLVAASAQLGAIFAGVDETVENVLVEYGEKLGVAFQLADDVIDVTSARVKSGKTPGTDLREGVPTLPVLLLRQAARDGDASAAEVLALVDGDLSGDEALAAAVAALGAHPVTEQSWAVARRWADEAMTALEPLPEGVVKESLANFALAVVDRTA